MASTTILYWRDIPAQLVGQVGRKKVRRVLPERFEKAIDAAAMASGAKGTDDYLAAWRRGDPVPLAGDLDRAVEQLAGALEAEYDGTRLRALIANGGWNSAPESTGE